MVIFITFNNENDCLQLYKFYQIQNINYFHVNTINFFFCFNLGLKKMQNYQNLKFPFSICMGIYDKNIDLFKYIFKNCNAQIVHNGFPFAIDHPEYNITFENKKQISNWYKKIIRSLLKKIQLFIDLLVIFAGLLFFYREKRIKDKK